MTRPLRIGLLLLAGLLALGTGFPLFALGYGLVNHVPGITAATVAKQAALFFACFALAAWVASVKKRTTFGRSRAPLPGSRSSGAATKEEKA